MTLRVTIPNISFLIFGHWRIDYCVVSIESSLPRTRQLVAHNCQILRVLTKTIWILSLLASMVILRASVCWCLLWGRLFSTKIKEKIFLVKILFYFFIKKNMYTFRGWCNAIRANIFISRGQAICTKCYL